MINLLNISRTQAQIIKGIAILLMIAHHFYGLFLIPGAERIKEVFHGDFFYLVGRFFSIYGKACVLLFAFVSGYAYYVIIKQEKSLIWKATWKRFSSFVPFFCFVVFLVYCLLKLFPAWLEVSFCSAILQCCGYGCIPDYWYISVVLVSTLMYFPILMYAFRHAGKTGHIFIFWGLLALSYFLIFINNILVVYGTEAIRNWLYWTSVHSVACTMPYFMLGYACRYVYENKQDIKKGLFMMIPAMVVSFSLSWLSSYWFVTIAVVVLSHYLYVKQYRMVPFLVLLGNFSACMWLNHRLIFGYWFVDVFYYKIPNPINYIVIVVLSLLLSIGITSLWKRMLCLINNRDSLLIN